MKNPYQRMASSLSEQGEKRERMAPTEVIKQRLEAKKALDDKIKKMFSPKPAEEKPEQGSN